MMNSCSSPLEEYAAKARKLMERIDRLPPEIRALVHEYGANRVLRVYHEGDSAKRVLEDIDA